VNQPTTLRALPPVAIHTSGKHKGKPLSENPYWLGAAAAKAGKTRKPPSSYTERGMATWLFGYDNPTMYDGEPPYIPAPVAAAEQQPYVMERRRPYGRPKGHMRLTTGGPLGFDIPREHHVVASAISPDFNSGVALVAFTGPPQPAWRSPYMVYELDYNRAMPSNSGDYQSRSEAYEVFNELAMGLGAGQPEEGVR
jgi:murein DD-endopeptidase MepM/ murein hydrolase activator NlpD